MTEIDHILKQAQRTQNPLEEAQKALEALEEAQGAQSPVEEARRALKALEEAQGVQNPLEEARRALEFLEEVERLVEDAWTSIESTQTLAELEQLRIEYLGRSAELTEMKKRIRQLPVELRPQIGGATNRASRGIEATLEARWAELSAAKRQERLRTEAVDVTLPGTPYPKGSLHPSQRVIDELVDFFVGLGYRVAEGPEVETDYYNFTALNIPPGHPARGEHDTFMLDEGLVLRTQTSPVQIRTMLAQSPPVYIVSPGRVYRRDYDPTHTPMFHQIEGLAFGMGPDRMAMVKYGVPDLRLFFEGDLRFLRQF